MATIPSPSTGEPYTAPAAIAVGHAAATDIGLLLLRLIVGVVFIYHGAQKLFGAFGGGGLSGFAQVLESMDIPLPMLSAILAACTEFFGGLAMLLGFGVRIAAIPMVINMLVAVLVVHNQAFSLKHNGMEYALTLLVVSLALGFTGAGRLSLSHLLRRRSRPTKVMSDKKG
jgi:putative oxidoreductase